ncbi:MAG: D-2-hydroxyacid dehydrogenase family protein [Burkholderiales bacterium]|nr:D-2-hydroxyacid dehydrogenase family protein [Burkholderiales bacterium]
MIVAIPDDYHDRVAGLACLARLSGHDVRISREVAPAPERLIACLRDAEVIVPIRERSRYTREIIERLPRLALISQTGRSTHHIDVAACTERGIPVAHGTHDSPHTVSEHTWALILSSLRRIPEETALMKRGGLRASFGGSLHGRTLGIYGLGRIGVLVAATGASFGMRVLVHGREASLAAARCAGYEPAASKEELFERADVLCVLLRMTEATRGAVTAADLARMKPTALFVNTARAALVAPDALVDALRGGRPGYAAVDVYENEPVVNGEHPLLKMDNVLCTPHTAWLTQDTYESYFGQAFDNISAFLSGRPVSIVNPEALARRRT